MSDKKNIAVLIGSSLAWREQVMRGIAGFAHEHGNWNVYTAPEGEEYGMFFTGGYRWDGLIIRPAGPKVMARVMRLGAPVVSVGSLRVNLHGVPRVKVNDKENTALIFRHLLSCGLKHFAYCSTTSSLAMEDRGPALVANVRAAGFTCHCFNQEVKLKQSDTWARRQKQLSGWLKELPKPVGIVAWSPDMACQIVEACNRMGIGIPQEVALIAADDDPMKCELTRPTITAAEIPAVRIGYEAASLLEKLMEGAKPPAGAVEVPPTGVIAVRQSTAIANAADREVRQAEELIRQEGGRKSVEALAAEMQVSPRWLQRNFKRVLGCTPRERLQEVRLESAKRLLLETDWTASRIALKAGFCSPSHLNQVMRRQMGLTPLAFRKRFRL